MNIDWSTGEPSPMYGAIRNWLNWSVGCAPVRYRMSWRSKISVPLNQYCITPSACPIPIHDSVQLEIGFDEIPVILVARTRIRLKYDWAEKLLQVVPVSTLYLIHIRR